MSEHPNCFGCKFLAYKGPAGLLPIEEVFKNPGVYKCRLFAETITTADKTPTPLIKPSRCKEHI